MYSAPPLEFVDERSEALRFKVHRALLGALSGFLGGAAFVTVAMFADRWLYPHLPMGLDWGFYRLFGLWLVPGLVLVGCLTAWWYETWAGLLTGTLVASGFLLLSNLPGSGATSFQKFAAFVIVFLPTMAACLPVAIFFRWLVQRHFLAQRQSHRLLRQGLLILLVLLVGGLGGFFMRMPARAADAVGQLNTSLQTLPDQKSRLYNLPGFDGHFGQPFELYYAKSTYTTQGYDVRAIYADGYTVTCAVVVYTGRSPYLTLCEAR